MKFKEFNLSNEIKHGLSDLGFISPLEVQEKTIPYILDKKDLIVRSQTGSGKTAAFAIPICENIDMDVELPQCIVLAPTRELAVQVKKDISDIGKHKGINALAVFGKEPIQNQRRELKKLPQIIVATPGRLLDLIERKNVKLSDVKYLVIDEADEIILMGFKEQIEAIIGKLPSERTTLLFSATMPDEVKSIASLYMNQPTNIEITHESTTIDRINQVHYTVDGLKKVDFIRKMLKVEMPRKTIVFCNTRAQVESVFEALSKKNQFVCCLHGGMDQRARTRVLTAFKKGEYNVMITTDVAARGIHVTDISHVINYSVPFDFENYVHRIGRTGRIDSKGFAITLVMPTEEERFEELEKFLEYKIPWRGGQKKRTQQQTPTIKFEETNRRRRYKAPNRNDKVILQINAGKRRGHLTSKDILHSFKKIPGILLDDIGKIDIRDQFTNIEIFNEKEDFIIKAFRGNKVLSKSYRIKKLPK